MIYKIKDLIAYFGSLSVTGAHAFRMVEAPIVALLFYKFFLSAELLVDKCEMSYLLRSFIIRAILCSKYENLNLGS
jgi:hypothetical protein